MKDEIVDRTKDTGAIYSVNLYEDTCQHPYSDEPEADDHYAIFFPREDVQGEEVGGFELYIDTCDGEEFLELPARNLLQLYLALKEYWSSVDPMLVSTLLDETGPAPELPPAPAAPSLATGGKGKAETSPPIAPAQSGDPKGPAAS